MIKKHITKNEYLYAGSGVWVRNLTKPNVPPFDLNNLVPEHEMAMMLSNEVENNKKLYPALNTESFEHKNIIIISSGHNFDAVHKDLGEGTVLGVNDTLNRWQSKKRLDYFVINNPYKECLNFLPKRQTWLKCCASRRTNPEFLEKFGGIVYTYSPVTDKYYSGLKSENDCYVDDYRNPVCAALGIAWLFKPRKIALLCCDELHQEERPGMICQNNFFYYPQQQTARDLIDANVFWMKKAGVRVATNSKILEYKNAEYIHESELNKFFNE